jgi:hypothetical protein
MELYKVNESKILTQQLTPASPDAGKTIHRRYTNIWMKKKGQWLLTVRRGNVICAN